MKEWLKPRTIFALMFYVAYLGLTINNTSAPTELAQIVSLLMGFYFGQKTKEVK